MDILDLLLYGVKNNASDLHLSAGVPPMIRVDGDMRKLKTTDKLTMEVRDMEPLDKTTVHNLVYDIMNDHQRKEFEETLECDFSFEVPNLARFRVNVFNQDRGMAVVFRTIPSKVITLEQLNCPKVFEKIASAPRGLVLVTGPTGSGKSTTLAAMVDYVNSTRHDHIITIEDPIEFVHHNKLCMVNQREVHRDTMSFSNALRSALREDPDIILVGELRDLETVRLALTAAETGHLVFGTLHTSSAAKTIDRIIDVFPGGGRVAAHEIMIGIPAIRNLIREDKVAQMYSIIQTGASHGMSTLDSALSKLVSRGIISIAEARSKAHDPNAIVASSMGGF